MLRAPPFAYGTRLARLVGRSLRNLSLSLIWRQLTAQVSCQPNLRSPFVAGAAQSIPLTDLTQHLMNPAGSSRPHLPCQDRGVGTGVGAMRPQYRGVDHGSADVFLIQGFLHGSLIVAGFQQMDRKRIQEGMAGCQSGASDCLRSFSDFREVS